MINKDLAHITDRIIQRSQATRQAYIQRMNIASADGRTRAALGCGNLAHGMATCSESDKQLIAEETVANLGIVNAYNDMLSAHQPYENYPRLIKAVAQAKGATAQVAGGVPAMCDGVTQGMPGMELSLFSRDLIAMATAVALSHNMFDGTLCLGVCDKIVPGLLIGALSFGHLPTVFLPAGPMPTGQGNKEKARVRQLYAEGKVDRKALLESESRSYHGAGTCTFYGTANSNQMLMEIMGLHLPGSSFIPPGTPLRDKLTQAAVERLIDVCDNQKQDFRLCDIISEKAIINGIVGLLATGGSTNHAIHLIAIAKAAGVIIDWQDMAELSEIVPLLCRIYPNGEADINHFQAAGGMGFLIKALLEKGLLHEDVKTIVGNGLSNYCQEPKLVKNPSANIFTQNSAILDVDKIKAQWINQLDQHQLEWQGAPTQSLDKAILNDCSQPFSNQGGLKLLVGNLGRSVIKVSAVKEEHQVVEAPALVFDSQEAFQSEFQQGHLEKDFIAVIKQQGPQSNGMPELHKLTPLLGVLQDKGFKVALVTDGRMSGASGKVPAAIHLVPEAMQNGPINKVKNGDLIRLDAKAGILQLLIAEEEFNQRSTDFNCDNFSVENSYGCGRELFEKFRQSVCGAEQGASIF